MDMGSSVTGLLTPRRPVSLKVFFGLALAAILLDQLTKLLIGHVFDPVVGLNAQGHLELAKANPAVAIIPGFFRFTYAINTGIAFSRFADQTRILALVSLVISSIVIAWAWLLKPGEQGLRLSLGLICGGAIGNLIDRVRLEYVVDFLDTYVVLGGVEHHFAIFNIADSAVCIGIFLLAVTSFWTSRPDDLKKELADG